MTQKYIKNADKLIAAVFICTVFVLIFRQWGISAPQLPVKPVLQLSSRAHEGFHLPHLLTDPVKDYLPPRGRISMITDHPYEVGKHEEELFYRAQNFLAPLVINRSPGEKLALIVCSDNQKAELRLNETGYKWIKNFGAGKGIAMQVRS